MSLNFNCVTYSTYSHPSTVTQRDGESAISFPIITGLVTATSYKIVLKILINVNFCTKLVDDLGQVCLNSMHSVNRLHQFYPNITLLDLNAFYGHFRKLENMTKFEWNKFISSGKMATSNLTDLYPSWADINSVVTG